MADGTRPEGNTVNLSRRLLPVDTVVGLQRRLNQSGFNSGKEDGIYGPDHGRRETLPDLQP